MANTAVLTGSTPGGLPYPESSDPQNQGANAIKALALALDPAAGRMQAGQVVATSNVYGAITITPPRPFNTTATPFPVIIAIDGASDNVNCVLFGSRYTAGETFITLFAWGPGGSLATNRACRVNWVAIG